MKRSISTAVGFLLLCLTLPAAAQDHRLSLLGGVQWFNRTGSNESSSDFTGTQLDVSFRNGAGIGAGFDYMLNDHFSIEARTSLVESNSTLRVRLSSDSVATLKLGRVRTYPTTAVLQYHFATRGDVRPYIGAGGGYTFVRDVRTNFGTIKFTQDAGLVANAGFDVNLSRRWDINLDGKYIPLETGAKSSSPGATDLKIRPILFTAGFRYKF